MKEFFALFAITLNVFDVIWITYNLFAFKTIELFVKIWACVFGTVTVLQEEVVCGRAFWTDPWEACFVFMFL